jgi:hypothetical protein
MSTIPAVESNELAILSRVLDAEQLHPEAAKYILGLTFPERDRGRMNVLADKARQGSLSPKEQAELEEYHQAGHLLTLLQSKARVALKKSQLGG